MDIGKLLFQIAFETSGAQQAIAATGALTRETEKLGVAEKILGQAQARTIQATQKQTLLKREFVRLETIEKEVRDKKTGQLIKENIMLERNIDYVRKLNGEIVKYNTVIGKVVGSSKAPQLVSVFAGTVKGKELEQFQPRKGFTERFLDPNDNIDVAGLVKRAAVTIPVWFAMRQVMTAVTTTVTDSIQRFKDLDQAIIDAAAQTDNKFIPNFEAFSGKMRSAFGDLSKETGQSISEISKAYIEFSTTGLSVEESLAGMSVAVKGSIATMADQRELAKLLATSYNNFNDSSVEGVTAQERMSYIMGVLNRQFKQNSGNLHEYILAISNFAGVAKGWNVTFREMVALVTVMHNLAQVGGTVGTQLAYAFQEITQNREAVERFLGRNIAAERPFDVFIDVIDKLNGITDVTERTTKVMSMFDKKGQKAVLAVADDSGWKRIKQQLEELMSFKLGDALYLNEEEFNRRMDTINRQLLRTKVLLSDIGLNFLTGLFDINTNDPVKALKELNKSLSDFIVTGRQFGEMMHVWATNPVALALLGLWGFSKASKLTSLVASDIGGTVGSKVAPIVTGAGAMVTGAMTRPAQTSINQLALHTGLRSERGMPWIHPWYQTDIYKVAGTKVGGGSTPSGGWNIGTGVATIAIGKTIIDNIVASIGKVPSAELASVISSGVSLFVNRLFAILAAQTVVAAIPTGGGKNFGDRIRDIILKGMDDDTTMKWYTAIPQIEIAYVKGFFRSIIGLFRKKVENMALTDGDMRENIRGFWSKMGISGPAADKLIDAQMRRLTKPGGVLENPKEKAERDEEELEIIKLRTDNLKEQLLSQGFLLSEVLKSIDAFKDLNKLDDDSIEKKKRQLEIEKALTEEKKSQVKLSSDTMKLYDIAQKGPKGILAAKEIGEVLQGRTSLEDFLKDASPMAVKEFKSSWADFLKNAQALAYFRGEDIPGGEKAPMWSMGLTGRDIPISEEGVRLPIEDAVRNILASQTETFRSVQAGSLLQREGESKYFTGLNANTLATERLTSEMINLYVALRGLAISDVNASSSRLNVGIGLENLLNNPNSVEALKVTRIVMQKAGLAEASQVWGTGIQDRS